MSLSRRLRATVVALATVAFATIYAEPLAADTITAAEIAAGISDNKTELEQESWWDDHMAGKEHEITGVVDDVEKGTFSGYWVRLAIGRNMDLRCGLEDEDEAVVRSLHKGDRFTCRGKAGNTWVSFMGVTFSMEGGTF